MQSPGQLMLALAESAAAASKFELIESLDEDEEDESPFVAFEALIVSITTSGSVWSPVKCMHINVITRHYPFYFQVLQRGLAQEG